MFNLFSKTKKIFLVMLATLLVCPPSFATFHDPTKPPAQRHAAGLAALESAEFTLDSVLVSSTRKLAMINGVMVMEGDHVGGLEVMRIRKGSVLLRGNNGIVTLHVNPYIAKREQRILKQGRHT